MKYSMLLRACESREGSGTRRSAGDRMGLPPLSAGFVSIAPVLAPNADGLVHCEVQSASRTWFLGGGSRFALQTT
jgi:hypothetical protein